LWLDAEGVSACRRLQSIAGTPGAKANPRGIVLGEGYGRDRGSSGDHLGITVKRWGEIETGQGRIGSAG